MRVFSNPQVDRAAVEEALRAAGVEFGASDRVQRTWLDSFDLRLTAAGMRLETAVGRTVTTGLFQADHPPAYLSAQQPPAFASDLAPGPFRDRLTAVVEFRALLPIATLRAVTRTGTQRNGNGKAVARVTLVDSAVLGDTGGASLGWAVELDDLLGYEPATAKLTKRLTALGLCVDDGDLFDLAVAANLIKLNPHDTRPDVRFGADERALPGYRRVLARLFETIEANWDGAARDVDSEFLHDLRVALRRTRTVLANAKGVIGDTDRGRFIDGFHALAQATSAPRDLDVITLSWSATLAAVDGLDAHDLDPVYRVLEKKRGAAHRALTRQLNSAGTARLLREWDAWLNSTRGDELVRAGLPLRSVVNRRLRRLRSRLRDDERDASPNGRHTARKDAKQLRYMIECFGSVYDQSARQAFVKELSGFQNRLGAAQDAHVRAVLLDDILRADSFEPATLVAAGRLREATDSGARPVRRRDIRLFTKAVDRQFEQLIESRP